MSRQRLSDSSGRIIGYIEDKTNQEEAFDTLGRLAGRYDKKANKTYDGSGRTVGTGNLLSRLLRSVR